MGYNADATASSPAPSRRAGFAPPPVRRTRAGDHSIVALDRRFALV